MPDLGDQLRKLPKHVHNLRRGALAAGVLLVEAAEVMSANSGAMQLRYLQTLADMSNTNSSTIVFPLPMDMIKNFLDNQSANKGPDKPDQ